MDASDAWALQAASGNDPDWTLDELAKMVDADGPSFPVTLLVNGIFIRGRLVKVDEWADRLDQAMDDLLGGAASAFAAQQEGLTLDELPAVEATAGDVERARAEWPNQGWRRLVEDRRSRERAARERLEELRSDDEPGPLESLPDDLARELVAFDLPKRSLTLAEVKVFPVGPGGATADLPFVRVAMAHVAAWGPGRFDFATPDP